MRQNIEYRKDIQHRPKCRDIRFPLSDQTIYAEHTVWCTIVCTHLYMQVFRTR